MKQNLKIAILFTIVTTVLLGIVYPLVVTGLAQVIFHDKANGQLISRNGEVVGSRIIGQTFAAPGYLHSRSSAAGTGYAAANSGATNCGPTNQKLTVPVELVTTSASGLDPELSPAGAEFQVPRIAHERGLSEEQVRAIIAKYSSPRQLGYLGEARVNVLEVNLALDAAKAMAH